MRKSELNEKIARLEKENKTQWDHIHEMRILLREHSDALEEIGATEDILSVPAIEPDPAPESVPDEGLVECVGRCLFEINNSRTLGGDWVKWEEDAKAAIHAVDTYRVRQSISEEMIEGAWLTYRDTPFGMTAQQRFEVVIRFVREWDLRGGKREDSDG